MPNIETIATSFHHACTSGAGWEACREYCTPDGTFEDQGEILADIHTLEAYATFLQNVFTPVPDFRHEVLSVGVDQGLQRVLVHYLIRGTHTGEGFPVPPTGKSMETHCVLILHFEGERIQHARKVWNDHELMKQVGWV